MARLNVATLEKYPVIKMEELQQPLLVVVDMINGFIKEGALHDQAIMEIVEPIKTLIRSMKDVVFVADTHEEDAGEFNSYPIHCLKDTSESEIIDELKPYVNHLITKNSTNTFHAEGWLNFMNEKLNAYDDIVISGCCSDICVMQFALSLQTYLNEMNIKGKRLIVAIDMVETYHIKEIHDAYDANTFSLANMAGNGIYVVQSIVRGEN